MMNISSLKSKSIALGFLSFFLIGGIALGFNEPTSAPPNGNVASPLNVGDIAQEKRGGLVLGSGLDNTQNGLYLPTSNISLGNGSLFVERGDIVTKRNIEAKGWIVSLDGGLQVEYDQGIEFGDGGYRIFASYLTNDPIYGSPAMIFRSHTMFKWYNGASKLTASLNDQGDFTARGFTSLSDERLKTNISPIQGSLDKVLTINGVTFDWKDKRNNNSGTQIGLIAQNVEKVFPELVHESEGIKSLNYSALISPVIESIKELNHKFEQTKRSSIDEKNTNYTLSKEDEIIKANSNSDTITLTLPSAQDLKGKKYTITKVDESNNIVSIKGANQDLINGNSVVSITKQYQYINVVSDGIAWYIIGNN